MSCFDDMDRRSAFIIDPERVLRPPVEGYVEVVNDFTELEKRSRYSGVRLCDPYRGRVKRGGTVTDLEGVITIQLVDEGIHAYAKKHQEMKDEIARCLGIPLSAITDVHDEVEIKLDSEAMARISSDEAQREIMGILTRGMGL